MTRRGVYKLLNGETTPKRVTRIALARALAYIEQHAENALAAHAADEQRKTRETAQYEDTPQRERALKAERVASLGVKLRGVAVLDFEQRTGLSRHTRHMLVYGRGHELSDATLTAIEQAVSA